MLNKQHTLKSLYTRIQEIENSNQKAVLCIIVSTKGSTPRKTGAKMLVFADGSIAGTIGGGALEKKVIEEALEVLKNGEARCVTHNLVNELDMCCGGTVELFLEPIRNKMKLYIFGAGHIGKALARFTSELDFSVSLIDERYDAFDGLDASEFKLVQEQHATAIEKLKFDEKTCVVILTHDHAYDREILALCAKKKNAYLGMVGSARKVEIAKKNLLGNKLMSQAEVDRVHMPIGLAIKAKTPEEIAISILAELISVRNTKQDD